MNEVIVRKAPGRCDFDFAQLLSLQPSYRHSHSHSHQRGHHNNNSTATTLLEGGTKQQTTDGSGSMARRVNFKDASPENVVIREEEEEDDEEKVHIDEDVDDLLNQHPDLTEDDDIMEGSQVSLSKITLAPSQQRQHYRTMPVQQYETPRLPCGSLITFLLRSTQGDVHYIGLNGLQLLDESGEEIPLSAAQVTPFYCCEDAWCGVKVVF